MTPSGAPTGLRVAKVSSNTIVALLVNSSLTIVLFDSGASNSFIAYQFVKKNSIPMCPLKNTLLVNSPGGEMQANLKFPTVELFLMGGRLHSKPNYFKGC